MEKYAFLDEAGDSNLAIEKEGVSEYFLVGGVIISADQQADLREFAISISKKHFSGAEIKSSGIGSNDKRRQIVLADALKGDFSIFALIVQKRLLTSHGFSFKRSFYQYLSRIAYTALYTSIPNLSIVADEHGRPEFQDLFVKYIQKHHPVDLFGATSIGVVNSKNSPCNQLADLFVGSILRGLANPIVDYLGILRASRKLLPPIWWPKSKTAKIKGANMPTDPIDQLLLRRAQISAKRHIAKYSKSDVAEDLDSVYCARLLLDHATYGDAEDYIYTGELLESMKQFGDVKATKKSFGRQVIDRLRDSGVLIAGGQKGYKLITSRKGFLEYADYSNHFIAPMINRLRVARDEALRASNGKWDLLTESGLLYLDSVINQ